MRIVNKLVKQKKVKKQLYKEINILKNNLKKEWEVKLKQKK